MGHLARFSLYALALCAAGLCGCDHGHAPATESVTLDAGSDAMNDAGPCGGTCDGTCSHGRCLTTLAELDDALTDFAIDDANAYFASCGADGTGAVFSVPLAGGTQHMRATASACPVHLAVADGQVYLTGLDADPHGYDSLDRLPAADGALTSVVSHNIGSLSRRVQAISANRNLVVWSVDGGELGSAEPLGEELPFFATCTKSCGRPFVTDDHSVFWADIGAGKLMHQVFSGSSRPVVLNDGIDDIGPLAVWDQDIYFGAGSTLSKRSTPDSVDTLATTPGPVIAIAVDSKSVYYASGDTIWKLARSGGTPVALAQHQDEPLQIAVDDDSVYWRNGTTGSGMHGALLKLTPK